MALDSFLSKIVTGTMIASSALAATLLWSAKDSSLTVLTSCAPSAPNSASFKPDTFSTFNADTFQVGVKRDQ